MSRLTLEISPQLDDVVTERLFDGLSVLLSERHAGRVTESKVFGTVNMLVIQSTNDAEARLVIEEILNNEIIPGSVTLAIGAEVPVVIRGNAWPVDPIHDSIIGSFTNADTETHGNPRICLFCRHFSMRPSGTGVDMQMRCAKSLDEDTFTKPLVFGRRPHESVLRMREAIMIANTCELFEED
jgi:hypothetical protein